MDASQDPCTVTVDAADLPHRGELALERDRGAVSLASHTLAGTSNRGERRTTPPFTVGSVREALTRSEPQRRRAGAVLVGRCDPSDPAGREALTQALKDTLKTETDALVKAELAMSAVLLKLDEPSGRLQLEAVADEGSGPAACVAAGYLAQLGDPRGWAAVLTALATDDDTPLRAEAVRTVPLFAQLDGAAAGDAKVDVRSTLTSALKDAEVGVRQFAVASVAEAELPDAIPLLEAVEAEDPSSGVKAVAGHWLWQLRRDQNAK